MLDHYDDDTNSAGGSKKSLIKILHDDDAHMNENCDGNSTATEFLSNVVTISGKQKDVANSTDAGWVQPTRLESTSVTPSRPASK